jgi:tryptophan synthase alpha chain
MSFIKNYIEEINNNGRKALSIFLTAGFPNKEKFIDLAVNVLNSGADMLEIGIPFSDPLADGSTIQASSKIALDNGITLKDIFNYCEIISDRTNKPLILMGYANPILKYAVKKFLSDAQNSGAKGIIVPDVPLEEYGSFYGEEKHNLDIILLTTPTSTEERIKEIDKRSKGFVYCVSITGTTGVKNQFSEETLQNIKRTRELITNNKMMIGFGISKVEDVKTFSPFCDGVIVGSAVIKSLLNNENLDETLKLISRLSKACE